MMDWCIALGLCLTLAFMAALSARAWYAAVAGGVLFLNWLLWSSSVLASDSWEPWLVAMWLDTVTAIILALFARDPVLAASSAHLVTLHMARALDWIDYDAYYGYGLLVGFAQTAWVIYSSYRDKRGHYA